MSYSFNIRAATLAMALAAVAEQIDKVVADQPIHAVDKPKILSATEGFLSLLPEGKEGQELSVAVTGWLNGTEVDNELASLAAVSFTVEAGWGAATPAS